MSQPLVYADYMKTDEASRLILSCDGTWKDFKRHGIVPIEGLALTFYMDDANDGGQADDLLVEGTLCYDNVKQRWLAQIDRRTFRHASSLGGPMNFMKREGGKKVMPMRIGCKPRRKNILITGELRLKRLLPS